MLLRLVLLLRSLETVEANRRGRGGEGTGGEGNRGKGGEGKRGRGGRARECEKVKPNKR